MNRKAPTRSLRRAVTHAVALAAVGMTLQAATAQLPSGTWQYQWGDDFTEDTLDTARWSYNYPWGPTHNHDAYMSPDNVVLGDGTLTLVAERVAQGGKEFTSGAVTTGYTRATFSSGYIEASIKLPDTPGSWPAFWGLYDGWPPEADIMEYPIDTAAGSGYAQDQYHTAFHYRNDSGGNSAGAGQVNPGGVGDLGGQYHTFGMEWREDDWVGFYFDGVRVSEFGQDSAIAQMERMYLILNYAVGGWPGTPNLTEWPLGHADETKVDYVRVWQSASQKTTNWLGGAGASYSWDDNARWSNGTANLGGVTANFAEQTGVAEQAVTWGGLRVLSGLNLSGATAYELGDGSSSRLIFAGADNGTGRGAIAASGAGHSVVASIELVADTTISNSSAEPLGLYGKMTGAGGVTVEGPGEVIIGNTATHVGRMSVRSGTLTLGSRGTLSKTPVVEIASGAALDVSQKRGGFVVGAGQTLDVDAGASVVGSVIAGDGSELSAAGSISGGLTARAGAVVRVAGEGLGLPSQYLIDDFESYATGDVRDVASPPWTAHQNTSLADIETEGAGNKALTYGWASDFRGVSRGLLHDSGVEEGDSATIFFRVNSKTDDPDHNFGIGDRATEGGVDFADYEAQVRFKQGAAAGTFDLDARDGGTFTATLASGLALNTWHNVWITIDQATDTYDVYVGSGIDDANGRNKVNSSPLSFRNGTTDGLNKLLGLAGSSPIDNALRIDDIYYLDGVDLTNPLGGLDPTYSTTTGVLSVGGDVDFEAGSIVEFDLLSPEEHDALEVAGSMVAGGELRVQLIDSASPEAGDEFDLFYFETASGAFDILTLPRLANGLTWNASQLLTTGVLAVIQELAGDYNADGVVDAADYTVWRDHVGQPAGVLPNDVDGGEIGQAQYDTWAANFGATLESALSAVPEPGSAGLLALAGALAAVRGRRVIGASAN